MERPLIIKTEVHGRRSSSAISMEEKVEIRQRVILFPLPLQGCISPMIQLGKILHSRGFSVTVIHTRFHAPNPSSHPHFTFLQIPDGLSEAEARTKNVTLQFKLLNRNCESPFRECLATLLSSSEYSDKTEEKISCLIDDSNWVFTLSMAESFGLRRFVLNTYKVTFFLGHFLIPRLRRQEYLQVHETEQDDPVPEFPPLRKKDLSRFLAVHGEILDPSLPVMLENIKASSGIIFMSCQELDQDSLVRCGEVFRFPIFSIGPFHSYFSASSSSLLTPDETCVHWLDRQVDRSVVYVSFGSKVSITETELLEIAWGLSNSDQPFLWVVRPGSVSGSTWIEPLPKGFMERIGTRGKIVKWAPQQEVLGHRATGAFLTHNGWNSTVESICEGVPMICLPRVWDQMLNARFVSDEWRVGIHLEDRVERREIERAVKRLMAESGGNEIRERMSLLKDEVGRSVKQGGSCYRSLDNLVDHISSFHL